MHLHAISRVSIFLDEKCRVRLYHSYILSPFNYCNIMWHHCDTDNTIKVEKIQKRALRVILNDYESTYDDILQNTGQSLMYTYRLRSIVLETFKSVSKLNPSFLHDLFHVKDSVYNLRGGKLLDQARVNTKLWYSHCDIKRPTYGIPYLHTWKCLTPLRNLSPTLQVRMGRNALVGTVYHVHCPKYNALYMVHNKGQVFHEISWNVAELSVNY